MASIARRGLPLVLLRKSSSVGNSGSVASSGGAARLRFAPQSVRSVMVGSSGNGNGQAATAAPRNILGGELQCCCTQPVTGYYRDGYCRTDASDRGRHVVCAQVTREFLEFSASRGNDLMTPAPWGSFPGLKPGDKWCLCASRWKEALDAGCAPPVFLACTHEKALEYVSMESLRAHAADAADA